MPTSTSSRMPRQAALCSGRPRRANWSSKLTMFTFNAGLDVRMESFSETVQMWKFDFGTLNVSGGVGNT